jgi:hypothetical protein
MTGVDIYKLMYVAAFDHVRMLSEPCVCSAAGHLKAHESAARSVASLRAGTNDPTKFAS